MSAPPVWLDAFAYELGEEELTLEELPSLTPELRQDFHEVGLRTFRSTRRTSVALAEEAAARTLAAAPERRGHVSHVLYTTSNTWDAARTTATELGAALRRLGLDHAALVGVSRFYCANLHAAVQLATGLIHSGQAEDVLVVCVDTREPGSPRLVTGNISVHSDAASSLLVTRSPSSAALRFLHTSLTNDLQLAALRPQDNFMRYMAGFSKGISVTSALALKNVGLAASQISRVLPNNYNLRVNRGITRISGFDFGQVHAGNIPRLGHAMASDPVINLVDSLHEQPVGAGEHLMLLGAGPSQWGATVLGAAT
ncbi:3-oxoacyl-[acyl-carrier-protein] synthase III C-terminal domain-containing protein [Streptomyces sp. NPDC005820]|uniref:3-oxoacyl-[acyl-carrier-protein] synthase III C-terminal domain-containing protein n=1 Tax=Streptomyces sp. NPDC005820 TaxID=3157069 RepID=UPI0033D1900C